MLKIQDAVPTPQEAADHLWVLSLQLAGHGVAEEHIEALQLISQRFTRHLNGLATFSDRLHDLAEGFLC